MSLGGGSSNQNKEFHHQLWLQELNGKKKEEEEDEDDDRDPFTYTDPADGTQYEWDREKRAWFPKITEDFLATYHANYGFPSENSEDSSASAAKTDSKLAPKPKAKEFQQPRDPKTSQPTDPKQKGEKRKPDAGKCPPCAWLRSRIIVS